MARGRSGTAERRGVVRLLAFAGDDDALVRGVVSGHVQARAALYDRFAAHAERLLVRVLGNDAELDDLLHDVFLATFATIHQLRDSSALQAWITRVAVFTARKKIRSRRRRAWLRLFTNDDQADAHEPVAEHASHEMREAIDCTYRVLDAMPADERIPFALRFIEGMELTEVASACAVSLATVKRRLGAAERSFRARALEHPALQEWVEGART